MGVCICLTLSTLLKPQLAETHINTVKCLWGKISTVHKPVIQYVRHVCISCDRQWKKQSNRKNTSKFQQRLKLDLRWQLNLQAFDKAPASSLKVSLSDHFYTIMKLHATRMHEFVMFWIQDSSCKAVPYSSWCHRVYKLSTKTFFFTVWSVYFPLNV